MKEHADDFRRLCYVHDNTEYNLVSVCDIKKYTPHIWSPPWFLPRPPKTCHFLSERVIGVSHTEVLSPLDDNNGFCSNEVTLGGLGDNSGFYSNEMTLGGLLDSFRLREGSPERPS